MTPAAAALAVMSLVAGVLAGAVARSAPLCPDGTWVDFMIGSHHIHPDRHFDDFNPGIGVECQLRPEWAASAGYFRNSVPRPSFYGGVVYTPEALHHDWLRFGAMGGVISGYNFGRWGVGENHHTGLVLAPSAIVSYRRFGANIILVPPIPADHVPFTIGLQAKYRFH